MKPPSVVLNNGGAEVQFDGIRQWGLDWSNVREIAIEVWVVADMGYSEAFWKITGPGVDFGAPVELVVGADELNARLFQFPGFDRAVYQRARDAEVKAEPGVFVCWRRSVG
jgi:hypothetical protein